MLYQLIIKTVFYIIINIISDVFINLPNNYNYVAKIKTSKSYYLINE